jgi:hypothetical protein
VVPDGKPSENAQGCVPSQRQRLGRHLKSASHLLASFEPSLSNVTIACRATACRDKSLLGMELHDVATAYVVWTRLHSSVPHS